MMRLVTAEIPTSAIKTLALKLGAGSRSRRASPLPTFLDPLAGFQAIPAPHAS